MDTFWDKLKNSLSETFSGIKRWFTDPAGVAVDTTVNSSEGARVVSENIGASIKNIFGGFFSVIIIPALLIILVLVLINHTLNKI
jgi:hypothetical protein